MVSLLYFSVNLIGLMGNTIVSTVLYRQYHFYWVDATAGEVLVLLGMCKLHWYTMNLEYTSTIHASTNTESTNYFILISTGKRY